MIQKHRPKAIEIKASPQRRRKERHPFKIPLSVVEEMLQGTASHPPVHTSQIAHELYIPHNGPNERFDDFVTKLTELGPAGSGSLFLKPESNPSMPKAYGDPGLLVAAEEFLRHQGRRSVFRYEVNSWRWVYLGDYVFRSAGSLTREQFCAQSGRAKSEWAKFVLHSRDPNYIRMRDRIEMKKSGEGTLDEDDIIIAYTAGEERVAVLRMECVDFKASSTKRVLQEFEAWKVSGELLKRSGAGASSAASSSTPALPTNHPAPWQWSATTLAQARSVVAAFPTPARTTTTLASISSQRSPIASSVVCPSKRAQRRKSRKDARRRASQQATNPARELAATLDPSKPPRTESTVIGTGAKPNLSTLSWAIRDQEESQPFT